MFAVSLKGGGTTMYQQTVGEKQEEIAEKVDKLISLRITQFSEAIGRLSLGSTLYTHVLGKRDTLQDLKPRILELILEDRKKPCE